jgi:hypothetical protein
VLRVPAPDDARGNLHVGAKPMATKLDERDTEIVRVLGPRLRARGHFFVGLDVIGGWLTEINVTSPTGILEANTLYNDAYEVKVVERLEQKTGDADAIRLMRRAASCRWPRVLGRDASAAGDQARRGRRGAGAAGRADAIAIGRRRCRRSARGAALRLRRVRAGEDVRGAGCACAACSKAAADAAGQYFAPSKAGGFARAAAR